MENNKRLPTTQEEKLDAILRILQGEPMDPKDEGMIGEVRFLKAELYKLKDWKSRTMAWALGVSFGGGALLAFISTIVFKH